VETAPVGVFVVVVVVVEAIVAAETASAANPPPRDVGDHSALVSKDPNTAVALLPVRNLEILIAAVFVGVAIARDTVLSEAAVEARGDCN
jgi:hypothetical protein